MLHPPEEKSLLNPHKSEIPLLSLAREGTFSAPAPGSLATERFSFPGVCFQMTPAGTVWPGWGLTPSAATWESVGSGALYFASSLGTMLLISVADYATLAVLCVAVGDGWLYKGKGPAETTLGILKGHVGPVIPKHGSHAPVCHLCVSYWNPRGGRPGPLAHRTCSLGDRTCVSTNGLTGKPCKVQRKLWKGHRSGSVEEIFAGGVMSELPVEG